VTVIRFQDSLSRRVSVSKLMDAIVALDRALEKGKVDAKVCGDLSASYMKELAGNEAHR